MQITTFNNTQLHLVEDEIHQFLVSNKEVALGYGTTIKNLTHTKSNNKDELLEGKHFIKLEVQTKGGKQKVIHWTQKGIVRLGFFIKSEKAKKFRDWAEDYIVNTSAPIEQDHLKTIESLSNSIQKLLVENERLQNIQSKQPTLEDKQTTLKAADKNLVLEICYQFSQQYHEAVEHVKASIDRAESIKNFLNSFASKYPQFKDYIEDAQNNNSNLRLTPIQKITAIFSRFEIES